MKGRPIFPHALCKNIGYVIAGCQPVIQRTILFF